ncbi:MAG: group III truncated hemoglobin [Pseudobdellovibrionaceae bacterium]
MKSESQLKSEILFPKSKEYLELNSVKFTFQDINAVVEDFYGKVAADPLLKIPFQSVEDWPYHVQRLTHFWWGRFGGTPYMNTTYNPPEKHFFAGFNQDFLARWLLLFQETLKNILSSEQADLWSMIAISMGKALTIKNELYRQEYEAARNGKD